MLTDPFLRGMLTGGICTLGLLFAIAVIAANWLHKRGMDRGFWAPADRDGDEGFGVHRDGAVTTSQDTGATVNHA